MAQRLEAHLKEEYRRNSITLLSGVEFRKDVWTAIPIGKEEAAKKAFADILDFRPMVASSPSEPEEVVTEPKKEEPVEDPITEEEPEEESEATPDWDVPSDAEPIKMAPRRKRTTRKKKSEE